MKSSTILSLVGVAVIMLIIGTALGSVGFPTTKTEASTLLSSVTSTQISTLTLISNASGQSYPIITITFEIVRVNPIVPTCVTDSGKTLVSYSYASVFGYSSTFTFLYPTKYLGSVLPPKFYVSVTTDSNGTYSNQTEPFSGSC